MFSGVIFHLNSSKVTPGFLMMISAENTPLKPAHNEISGMIFTDTQDSNMPKKIKRSKLSAAVVIQRGMGFLLPSPIFQNRGALRSGAAKASLLP